MHVVLVHESCFLHRTISQVCVHVSWRPNSLQLCTWSCSAMCAKQLRCALPPRRRRACTATPPPDACNDACRASVRRYSASSVRKNARKKGCAQISCATTQNIHARLWTTKLAAQARKSGNAFYTRGLRDPQFHTEVASDCSRFADGIAGTMRYDLSVRQRGRSVNERVHGMQLAKDDAANGCMQHPPRQFTNSYADQRDTLRKM